MQIKEMAAEQCRAVLKGLGYGKLGCARDHQPYIVPIFFAFEDDRLYCFSTLGRKIEWMRSNPLVCVQADEIRNHMDWTSVIALGRYQELPDDNDHRKAREHALTLLQWRPRWWQGAYTTDRLRGRPGEPILVVFCVNITEISGHRAEPDEADLLTHGGEPRE